MKKKMPLRCGKKNTANKPKPKPIKIDDLMKTWMVNTISKTNWINQLKTLFFRCFFSLFTIV
jgi:hypothetical protein